MVPWDMETFIHLLSFQWWRSSDSVGAELGVPSQSFSLDQCLQSVFFCVCDVEHYTKGHFFGVRHIQLSGKGWTNCNGNKETCQIHVRAGTICEEYLILYSDASAQAHRISTGMISHLTTQLQTDQNNTSQPLPLCKSDSILKAMGCMHSFAPGAQLNTVDAIKAYPIVVTLLQSIRGYQGFASLIWDVHSLSL